MMKLLAFLWTGCWHRWIATGGRTDMYETSASSRPIYSKYRYRCEKCHRIREFRA